MKKVGIKIKMPHLRGSGFKIIILLASQQKDLGSVEGRQDFVQSPNMDFAVANNLQQKTHPEERLKSSTSLGR